MKKKRIFEVCAFNTASAVIAENAGAYRVELCDNPVEGGTTPSYGALKKTRELVSIKLYPIIRPRCGNYFYNEEEMDIIRHDIWLSKELQCDGISVGVQRADGRIDTEAMKRIVEWAYPMGVTCNRAFDAAPEPFQAMEDIISTGCERILTSGQENSVMEGAALLAELVQRAGERIVIMPGAGVKSGNIVQLMGVTKASEYHGSARIRDDRAIELLNPGVLDNGMPCLADEEEIRKIVSFITEFQPQFLTYPGQDRS